MKPVLTKSELADRWNVDTRTIDKWEQNKVIQRIEGIPAPRYSMEHIQKIEGIKNINQFSPLERRRLENELDKLRVENEKLKSVISRILAESAKIIDM
ncbi:histidine kinase [uncultured Clostridium sp.]|uniref:histidine kinase n=1 Tax=uncultured Clostridium sp. TaxID=59620 RepID=UPI0026393006|nr:histidine kinase [uncultured Clostridium sp.]